MHQVAAVFTTMVVITPLFYLLDAAVNKSNISEGAPKHNLYFKKSGIPLINKLTCVTKASAPSIDQILTNAISEHETVDLELSKLMQMIIF